MSTTILAATSAIPTTLDGRLIGKFDGTNTQYYLTDALGSVLSTFSNVAMTTSVRPIAPWDKVFVGSDLAFNVFSDVAMVTSIGEAVKTVSTVGKLGVKLLVDVGKNLVKDEAKKVVVDEFSHVADQSFVDAAKQGVKTATQDAAKTATQDVAQAACGGGLSFVFTTKVATAQGEQAIGNLKVGQKVWSYNPQTQKMELQPILHVWINHDNDLVDLTITSTVYEKKNRGDQQVNEVIHTNKKHPFLTQEGGFVPVADLNVDMHVVEADGSVGMITGWAVVPGAMTMYNLEVAQDHTFAVGDGQWVVHNDLACGIHSSLQYIRKLFGKTPSKSSTGTVVAGEPDCHWCKISPSTVGDHEPALKPRWGSGEFDGMNKKQARAAADDPKYMVGTCVSCNASKSGRTVGTGPGQWDPRTSPNNLTQGGPGTLPWIW